MKTIKMRRQLTPPFLYWLCHWSIYESPDFQGITWFFLSKTPDYLLTVLGSFEYTLSANDN